MAITSHQNITRTTDALQGPSVADFWQLLKPRVMSLVIFTGFAGMFLAPADMHPLLFGISLFAIAAGAGASGAINQWYDRDIDAIMMRTRNRPIPSGAVEPAEALSFGLVISALSVLLLGLASNWFAAGLLAFTIFFYGVVYSIWLKRRTPQNIVIGGAAGALPPVIGWVAVTGMMPIEPLILFAIIFMWTPPHFWALALVKNDDYRAANIPMLPVVVGVGATVRQILFYTLALAVTVMLPYLLGFSGMLYGVGAGVASAIFVSLSLLLAVSKDARRNRIAGMVFAYSIFYLFVIFALLPADRLMASGL